MLLNNRTESASEVVCEEGEYPPATEKGLRLAGVVFESVTDGPGIRLAIFVQGCLRDCEGCHNQSTYDVDGGSFYSMEELKRIVAEKLDADPLTSGVTFSGGEPLLQAEALSELAAEVIKPRGLDLMLYTGYTFEEIMQACGSIIAGDETADNENDDTRINMVSLLNRDSVIKLLTMCDRLVDGPFVMQKRDLTLKFRGSSNQRYIDVQASLRKGCTVEFGPDEWELMDLCSNGDY